MTERDRSLIGLSSVIERSLTGQARVWEGRWKFR